VPVSTGPPPENEEAAPAGTRAADLRTASEPSYNSTTRSDLPASPDGRALIRRDEWADLEWRDARHWTPLDLSWCVERTKDASDEILLKAYHNRDKAALHCTLYMPTVLKLAIGGELRAFVPFVPTWCRTLPDELLFHIAAGSPLSQEQIDQLYDLETATEKFQAIGRVARRDDGDTDR